MGKFDLKKLPKGFRFLFSLKEIKEIENFAGIDFTHVTNGNLTNSKNFNNEAYLQSSFQGFSIQGKMRESVWNFNLHQSGFRNELLPKIHEEEIKTQSKQKIKEYLNKVYYSKQTDLYKNPQLREYIHIIKGKAEVFWTEIK